MKIFAWGSNSHGQLGLGVRCEQAVEPERVADVDVDAESIVGGGKHTILVTKTGDVLACGDNDQGQLGKDLPRICLGFERIRLGIKVEKVSCGWDFTLAISERGVVAWGGNAFGQLGLPASKRPVEPREVFSKKAVDVAAGLRHSAVVAEDGSVWSSGSGRKGQLGLGDGDNRDSFTRVTSIADACRVACGESHTVVSTRDGSLITFGDNRFGQLGIDPKSTSGSRVPAVVARRGDIKSLASGWSHAAILTDGGEVASWGRNDYGQLGEERKDTWTPRIVEGLTGTRELVLGSNHGVAVKYDNQVICWGWNEHGNCGNGECANVARPASLKALRAKLVGTGSAHSFLCAD